MVRVVLLVGEAEVETRVMAGWTIGAAGADTGAGAYMGPGLRMRGVGASTGGGSYICESGRAGTFKLIFGGIGSSFSSSEALGLGSSSALIPLSSLHSRPCWCERIVPTPSVF